MTPGPTNVSARVMQAMNKPILNHRGPDFEVLFNSYTENLKYSFQTKNEVFALACSGTGGVECVVDNIVNSGDKIIVPVFGLFSSRLREAVTRRGGQIIELSVDWGKSPKTEQILQLVEEEKNVKAIAVVYNETSTGVTVRDLPEIGKITREKDILFVVDAVSILGGDYLPVDKWGVDLCITGSQKCLACPPGLAMVSVNENGWDAIEKTKSKPFYFDLTLNRDFGSRGYTPFTPALPIVYALDESLKMIREEGLEKRIIRHKTCAKAFYEAIQALGLTSFTDKAFHSSTVIAVNVPRGIDSNALISVMRDRYNVVIAGSGGKIKGLIFRIGCMGLISEKETISTINALENGLKDLGYSMGKRSGVDAAKRVFH